MRKKTYPHLLMCILLLVACSHMANASNETGETNKKEEFAIFHSPYFAMAFVKEYPMMAYFNIESGGRSGRYMDKSLLRSGLGGVLVSGEKSAIQLKCESETTSEGISYKSIPVEDGNELEFSVIIKDKHSFQFNFSSEKKVLNEEFFKIATAPDIAPISIWAEKSKMPCSYKYNREKSYFNPEVRKASFKLPAIFHFPDYGLVQVDSDNSDAIYIQEHIIPDYSNTGLSLGPYNQGPHPGFRAYHKGTVLISFHTKAELKTANLQFKVLDENYPKIQSCDFSDARFDGLKRCWQNSFPVNPQQQCMGDNILLNGIAHLAMQNKADKLVFTSDLPGSESMINSLNRSLEITFTERVRENGRIDDYGWESTEICLIALYDYLLITNDWEFIHSHISNIKKVVQSVLNTDTDNDGIFESPFHGNYFDSKRSSLNWWDDFAFGHKDAYVNLKAYRALKGMNTVFAMLKLKEAEAISNKLKLFQTNFHETFFNPETGVYGGWISENGKMHDYMFSFINGMAINQGLVDNVLAKEILKRLLSQMQKEGYDFRYGVPGPTLPVDEADHHGWEQTTRWGYYENGGLCGQTAYHFIQALYNVGMRDKADEILFKMIATFEREPTHSGLFPGYLQSVDWRTKGGAPTGYNYLADNYYFLLAAITGYYGIEFPELKKPE